MKMKKWAGISAALMAAVMAMTGCGGNSNPAEGETNADAAYTVGIVQLLEHPALDAATEGFQDKLKELLGDDVQFDYQNAQGEQTNCTTIATKFVSNDVDLIMANATTALQSAAAATADIPIVGTSVTDYKTAGVINENDAPGTNVTGVSDLAPVDEQIALLQKVCPDAKKVAIVYCSAEPNSIFQADLAKKYLADAGLESAEYTAADSNEIQAVITKAISECDTVYIPTDNTIANNVEIIKNVTVPAGIPVICGEENLCAGGGLATLSISYYELGQKAGEMAYEILVNGADPATMPIAYVSDNIVAKYNAEVAEALGITMPEDMVVIE
ncbi:MAG: ABC transporter substrate-binding protein [Anaerotignum sp.]|nr:ABC transporter substrate-binding protein [Anaerotignum sp.]